MKKFGTFLLEKDAHAATFAFLCALLPMFNFPVGFIAAIIVGLITLQKGCKSGLFLLAWVALPSIALLVLRKVGVFDVLLLRCIMMWFFALILRRYHRWLFLFAMALCVGAIFVFLVHHFVPNLEQWWTTKLTVFVKQYVAQSHEKINMTPAEFAGRIAPFATALATFFFMCGLLLELMIARLWQNSLLKK